MAVHVNHVYRTVLAFLNKEQRGFLTPEQFNRFAKMAQHDLINEAFYDYNRALTRNAQGAHSEYNLIHKLREKLDFLVSQAELTNDNGTIILPNDLLKLFNVSVGDGSTRTTDVERITRSELNYYKGSQLAAPDKDFPVFYQENGTIKIWPQSNDIIASVTVDYLADPVDPKWAYTGGGSSAYTYDEVNSVNFELHHSEAPSVVKKILAYAGVTVKDPNVIQMAQSEQASEFNKENA